MIAAINKKLKELRTSPTIKNGDYSKVEQLYQQGNCQILAYARQSWDVLVTSEDDLSGLLKMTTGKDTGFENKKVEIDKETGDVVMRFKLPKM